MFLIYLHIFIWLVIVLGGFVSKRIATLNIYILIPLVFILHMLPFHVLNGGKYNIIKDEYKGTDPPEVLKGIEDQIFIKKMFNGLYNIFGNSFQNPLSPQGMLILGFIISLYAIRYNLFLIK
jgi:hypothetical protein